MFRRHELVWLSDAGWRSASASVPADARHRHVLERWRANDWPLIARRADAGLADRQLGLGLAMPPDPTDGSKVRIALRADIAGISRTHAPLPLADAIAAAPEVWRAPLAALDSQACAMGITVRTYGSLALQALTGQTYLTPTSDIDLLIQPDSPEQLERVIALFEKHSAALPLDGEIVFGDGAAVAWKECARALHDHHAIRVLAKHTNHVRLMPMRDLIDTLQAARCELQTH